MKNNKPNAALVWKQLEEDLVPRLGLNLAERVVYAHLLRLSRLAGQAQLRFSLRRLALDTHISKKSARKAVRRLVAKGALRLIERTTAAGHLVEVRLPQEALTAASQGGPAMDPARRSGAADLEHMNFMQKKTRRDAIHARDRGLCFYCLIQLTPTSRCLDHVVPEARGGTNSYLNLVSCCAECNEEKGLTGAEDFLRTLYRQRRITSVELEARLRALEALAAGELRPILGPPATVSLVVGAGLAPPAAATKKPENPHMRKQTSRLMRKAGLPLLPKLARRKKARPVGAAFTDVPSSPKSPNPIKGQNRKPAP